MQGRDYRLAAIMHTDIVGFGRMLQQDEKRALELLEQSRNIIGELAKRQKGRVIKTIGDDVLAEFSTALDAVNCALAIQSSLKELYRDDPESPLVLRIGVHLGDIHFLDGDALGDGIAIAQRLATVGTPGCVCISQEVHGTVSAKLTATVKERGTVELKSGAPALRCFEIVPAGTAWQPLAASDATPTGPASDDFEELKSYAVEQIKRLGRRVSVERIRQNFPNRGIEFERTIERLAAMGFLSRGESTAAFDPSGGAQGGGPTRYPLKEPAQDPGWGHADVEEQLRAQERERREELRDIRRQRREHEHAHDHHHHHHHHGHDHHDHEGVAESIDWTNPIPYEEYRARVIERGRKSRGGLTAHLINYVAVNGGLLFLNVITGFHFPWFIFPLGGWGIGIVSHMAAASNRRREAREVEALPDHLEREDYELLVSYQRSRSRALATTVSLVAVSGFLAVVNAVTSPHFPWAVFPIAAMTMGVAAAVGPYLPQRRKFFKRFRSLVSDKPTLDARAAVWERDAADPPVVTQALELAESILSQSDAMGRDQALPGEDLKGLLNDYLGQIRQLSRRSGEVEAIIAAIPRHELERDERVLKKKFETAPSEELRSEYQKSIDQIERQNSSFGDLVNRKELMDLRIANSVNSLKQMRLDLARMAEVTASAEPAAFENFKEKTRDLSDYIKDMRAGYDELEATHGVAEAERERADQLLAEFKKRESRSKREKS